MYFHLKEERCFWISSATSFIAGTKLGAAVTSLLFGSPFGLHLQDLTDKLEGLHFSVFFQERGPTVRC